VVDILFIGLFELLLLIHLHITLCEKLATHTLRWIIGMQFSKFLWLEFFLLRVSRFIIRTVLNDLNRVVPTLSIRFIVIIELAIIRLTKDLLIIFVFLDIEQWEHLVEALLALLRSLNL